MLKSQLQSFSNETYFLRKRPAGRDFPRFRESGRQWRLIAREYENG